MYDAWKSLELKIRREYRTQPTNYDANYYASQYEICKSEYRAEKKMKDMFSQVYRSTNTRDDNHRSGFNNCGGKSSLYRPRGVPTSSFPSSSRRTTLPVCCILCGEKGHPVGEHYNGNIPTKGSDGKAIWAKIINSLLCTPDGRGICINYNVMGSRGCTLTKCERAHVCSFCGSKNHHAFSWICRSRPYSE